MYVHMNMLWSNNLQESVLSFHHVGSRGWILVVKLNGKYLMPAYQADFYIVCIIHY